MLALDKELGDDPGLICLGTGGGTIRVDKARGAVAVRSVKHSNEQELLRTIQEQRTVK